jgi:hypothetical protein
MSGITISILLLCIAFFITLIASGYAVRGFRVINDELAGAHRTAPPLLNSSLSRRTLARIILNGKTDNVVDDKALVVFVCPRCVSSYRALAFMSGQAAVAEAGFAIIIVVVADSDRDAERMRRGIPASFRQVSIHRKQLPGALRPSLPFAVALGRDCEVGHAGGLGETSMTAKFVEACGDIEMRHWLNALPAGAGADSAIA